MRKTAKVTVLGCGTSTGVPAIGCNDPVCLSNNPRNKRLRPSIIIQTDESSLLVDTSPDLRQQALEHGLRKVDAVIYTHYHADHTFGIDDLRVFNMIMKKTIPCYAYENTLKILNQNFQYIFSANNQHKGFKPRLTLNQIGDETFEAAEFKIIPIELDHAGTKVMGIRIGDFVYATDCSNIPESSLDKMQGVKTLIIDALRHRPHPSHLTVDQAVEISDFLRPQKTYFTHTNYELEYEETNRNLPDNIQMAYDGLCFDINL
ncbi:MAG: MBL fold metallo-hydrolase [Nitrospinota bacterium]|nr:MBL fold metallo-hydrolase [Nitrospinota bacterium]